MYGILQETWLSKEKHFAIEGYAIHRRGSTIKSGHRGLVTLIRNDLNKLILKHPDISHDQTEILTVVLQSNPPLTIHNVYHPPEIKATTWKFKTEPGTLIAGDINGHHSTWSNGNTNITGNSFYDWSLEAAFQILNKPQQQTRPQSSASPDVIALDISLDAQIELMKGWGSDHLPLKLTIEDIKIDEYSKESSGTWKWKWHCADWNYYKILLERAAPKLERIKNVQKLATRINNEILRAAGRAIRLQQEVR